MIREIVAFVGLLTLLILLIVFFRRQENRWLKSRTRDLLSNKLKEEVESERQASLERKKKFDEALVEASGKEPPS